MIRCAIYARFSSDHQRDASIDDQVRICRARAEREGWQVVDTFSDAAISGTTLLRPGLQAMLATLQRGGFDVLLTESLDRLSRDQEHIASLYKQVTFADARIVTLSEGEISELHIGLKGTMGALYLKDLADKTRRGQEGRILAGRGVGRLPYGYRRVIRLAPDGEPERGLREIDPAEAAVVRRIFTDYVAGLSPKQIAKRLNQEGVPSPAGATRADLTIRGRAGLGNGILRNPIYDGRLLWNRKRNLKDPMTGKRRARVNAESERVETPVPELRIVDAALWQAAQDRLAAEAAPVRTSKGEHAFWEQRRPKHLTIGKVVCGVCGGAFVPRGRDYLACHRAIRSACGNRASVRRPALERLVMAAMGRDLMQPEMLRAFT